MNNVVDNMMDHENRVVTIRWSTSPTDSEDGWLDFHDAREHDEDLRFRPVRFVIIDPNADLSGVTFRIPLREKEK